MRAFHLRFNKTLFSRIDNIEYMEVFMIVLLIVSVLFLIVFIPFAIKRKREQLSGEYGERKISEYIDELKREHELVINNYLASRNRSGSSSIQIDHIFISHKGVFVIETKDYRGRIYGDIKQNYWTQVLSYGKVKNKLYNPIKQNETHVSYVERIIGEKLPVYNIVIFLKADLSRTTNSYGILFSPNAFVYWYRDLPDNRLSDSKIAQVHSILLNEMNNSPITKEQHIDNVRRMHGNN